MNCISQKNNFSCAPVAIKNALTWGGKKVNLNSINEKCNCTKEKMGTNPNDFKNAMQYYFGNKTKKIVKPNFENIKQHLENGSCILRYFHYSKDLEDKVARYIFISKFRNHSFSVYNLNREFIFSIVNEKLIEEIIKEKKGKDYCHAWFIEK